ncbi:uncharacterized protein LOC100377340 [Saccoglossus kowalevskii]|uniref:Uncharacterized protein LOC100377340 n=1 Tax=Saccoglossus kowalevskii TaxID=10224 RepID=A0ABM0MNM9_SACKO|nr:PREDICTED: uncharacterized protein LOC100377340 [Saccoglossus kowalevskii]
MADQTIDSLLASLASMGFEITQCQRAVQAGKLTVQSAVEWILQGGQETATIPTVSSPQSSTQAPATLRLPAFGHTGGSLQPDPNLPTSTDCHVEFGDTGSEASQQLNPGETRYRQQDVYSRFSLTEEKVKEKESWEEKQRKQATLEAKQKRLAEKKAKDQVLREIAADREAQKLRMRSPPPPKEVPQAKPESSVKSPVSCQSTEPSKADMCMLQIRLQTGQILRQSFMANVTLQHVFDFVMEKNPKLRNVGFMQPFPRREFSESDMTSSLAELGLTPNGALVVKKLDGPTPQKVSKENSAEGSASGSSQASPTSPSDAPAGIRPPGFPFHPAAELGLEEQHSSRHQWGRGNKMDDQEMENQDERAAEEPVPMVINEHAEEEEGDDNDDDNIAVPGAMAGWGIPPVAPGNLFGGQFGGGAHDWGAGHSMGHGVPDLNQGLPADNPEEPSVHREAAVAAALQRMAANQKHDSQSSRRCLALEVHSLLELCVSSIAHRVKTQHQHLNLGAMPLDVAEKLLKVMMVEGTLRPKTLNIFLPCRLRQLVLDCYKYTTNELLFAVRLHTNLVHLSLCSCPLISDNGVAPLKTLKRLKHLNLSSCRQLTDKVLDTVKVFKYLVTLSLEETSVTDRGMQSYLQSSPSTLSHLNLNKTSVTDATLQALSALTHLKSLGLEGTKISHLDCLKALSKLQSLNICSTNLPAIALSHLKSLTSLSSLNISNIDCMNGDEALQCLSGLKLTHLKMPSRHTTTDVGLKYISDMPLVVLDLTDYIRITDEGVRHLSNMRSLNSLFLVNTKITDDAMTHIQGLSNLVELCLDHTEISNKGATVLGFFNKLQVLGLASTRVTSKLLKSHVLNKLVMLNKLNLRDTKIRDNGLDALKLPHLTLINLDRTQVSPNAIEHLQGCPQLKFIRMKELQPRRHEDDDTDD